MNVVSVELLSACAAFMKVGHDIGMDVLVETLGRCQTLLLEFHLEKIGAYSKKSTCKVNKEREKKHV